MARVNTVKLKLVYEDATSRTYSFNGVDDQALAPVKVKVLDINDSLSAGTATAFANTFVSDNGARCKMIADAQLISTEQIVIYQAS